MAETKIRRFVQKGLLDKKDVFVYYQLPYTDTEKNIDKNFVITLNLEESKKRKQPVYFTNFRDANNNIIKCEVDFVQEGPDQGKMKVSTQGGKTLLSVRKPDGTPTVVELPLTNSNCPVFDQLANIAIMPNEAFMNGQTVDRFLEGGVNPNARDLSLIHGPAPVLKEVTLNKEETPKKEITSDEKILNYYHPENNMMYHLFPYGDNKYITFASDDKLMNFYIQVKDGDKKPEAYTIPNINETLDLQQVNGKTLLKVSQKGEEKYIELPINESNCVFLEAIKHMPELNKYDKYVREIEEEQDFRPYFDKNRFIDLKEANLEEEKKQEEEKEKEEWTYHDPGPLPTPPAPGVEPIEIKKPGETETEAELDELQRQKILGSIRKAQKVEREPFAFGDDKVRASTQSIDLKKIDKNLPSQKLTVFDNEGAKGVFQNAILTVSQDGAKKPTAVFTQDSSNNISVKIEKEYLDNFIKENPSLNLTKDAKTAGDFYVFPVEKLKLSESLDIEDVQIKAANTDFALLFSALGCQIKDSANNLGKQENTTKPFNIGVAQQFLTTEMTNDKVTVDKNKYSYEAMLVSAIDLERQKQGDKQCHLEIPVGDVKPKKILYSVPYLRKDKDGNEKLSHIRMMKEIDENGKEKNYCYLAASGQGTKSPKRPHFYEIDLAGIEANNSADNNLVNSCVYLGLKDSNVPRVSFDVDLEKNKDTLLALTSILKSNFSKRNIMAKNDPETLLGNYKNTSTGDSFLISQRPANSEMNLDVNKTDSFDDIAILSKENIEEPVKEEKKEDPPPPPPPPEEEEEEEEEDPPPPPPPPKKEEPKPEKKPFKLPTDFFWLIIISTFLLTTTFASPIFAVACWAAGATFGIFTILNKIQPWKYKRSKAEKEAAAKEREAEMVKLLTKERDMIKGKINVNEAKKNKLLDEKQAIMDDPRLSQKQKDAKIKKIDNQIKKLDDSIKKDNDRLAQAEQNLAVYEANKNISDIEKDPDGKKKFLRDKQLIEKAANEDLKDLQEIIDYYNLLDKDIKHLDDALAKESKLTKDINDINNNPIVKDYEAADKKVKELQEQEKRLSDKQAEEKQLLGSKEQKKFESLQAAQDKASKECQALEAEVKTIDSKITAAQDNLAKATTDAEKEKIQKGLKELQTQKTAKTREMQKADKAERTAMDSLDKYQNSKEYETHRDKLESVQTEVATLGSGSSARQQEIKELTDKQLKPNKFKYEGLMGQKRAKESLLKANEPEAQRAKAEIEAKKEQQEKYKPTYEKAKEDAERRKEQKEADLKAQQEKIDAENKKIAEEQEKIQKAIEEKNKKQNKDKADAFEL